MNSTIAFDRYLNEPGGHALLDFQGTIVRVGPEYAKMTYKDPLELVGHTLFEKFTPRDAKGWNTLEEVRNSIERVHATGKPDKAGTFRFDLKRPEHLGGDWDEKWWEVTHIPILQDDGQLTHIVQRIQDQTTLCRVTEMQKRQERRSYLIYAVVAAMVIAIAYVGFNNSSNLHNFAIQNCTVQQRALPANHELRGVVLGLHSLVTLPAPKAERQLTKQITTAEYRRKQKQTLHQLDRHLTRYLYLESKVPNSRHC